MQGSVCLRAADEHRETSPDIVASPHPEPAP